MYFFSSPYFSKTYFELTDDATRVHLNGPNDYINASHVRYQVCLLLLKICVHFNPNKFTSNSHSILKLNDVRGKGNFHIFINHQFITN